MRHSEDRPAHATWIACAVVMLFASCATTPPPAAIRPTPLPEDAAARQVALGQIGRQLYTALADGEPERLMLDASEFKAILDTDGAMRVSALRARGTAPGFAAAEQRAAYGGSVYQGICFDRARLEPAGGNVGLLMPAFMFDRALVVGKLPDGSAIAAWIEGMFMGTGDLVVALVVGRIEAARRDHPDFTRMHCDIADGLESFHPVIGTGTAALRAD